MVVIKNGRGIRSLNDWFKYAPPKGAKKHWVPGRSAVECAKAWLTDDGPCVPFEIQGLLDSHPDIRGAEVVNATPEHQVRFDKVRGEPRNSDLVAMADHPDGPIAISIEAKADEPFDRLVAYVLASAADRIAHGERSRIDVRIRQLAGALFQPPRRETTPLGQLRYQLLTATAGALAFAIERKASRAVLIIHEFSTAVTAPAIQAQNQADLNAFILRLSDGIRNELSPGQLVGPYRVPGAPLFSVVPALYIGKVVRVVEETPS